MGTDFTSWNAQVIEEFRATGGEVGAFPGRPMVILHSTGARSGKERVNPLTYMPKGRDSIVVFASRGGGPTHPDWYHNLVANPECELEFGDRTLRGRAAEVTGEERDRLYALQAQAFPQFAEYEQRTSRTIPVLTVALEG